VCYIYVFGGHLGLERQTSVFKYNTETDTWSMLEPMPLPSSSHSVNVLDGDQVYIVGAGDDGKGVLRFDTSSGMWSTLGATSNKKDSSATFVVGGCLYVAGGGDDSSSSVERYDVVTDTWTAVADMLEVRCYHGAVTIGSADPAEEQDLFDSLIAKAVKERL
jgi:kelch-like protein 18